MLKLNISEIKTIRDNKATLQIAEKLTGVPWQLLASVWYREAGLGMHPTTVGGCFQFDPVPSDIDLAKLLVRFSSIAPAAISSWVHRGVNDFAAASVFCACFLRNKTPYFLTQSSTDEMIKDALYGYNGRMYGSVNNSPYVMNGLDDSHLNMHLRGTLPDGHGGRKHVDIIDKRLGAFTVYVNLRQLKM